jgi:hypothetical protein
MSPDNLSGQSSGQPGQTVRTDNPSLNRVVRVRYPATSIFEPNGRVSSLLGGSSSDTSMPRRHGERASERGASNSASLKQKIFVSGGDFLVANASIRHGNRYGNAVPARLVEQFFQTVAGPIIRQLVQSSGRPM